MFKPCSVSIAALCSVFDQLCITIALKLENTGAIAVIQTLCVVLSFIFSALILNEPLYLSSILGGAFIFTSVLILGLSKMFTDTNYLKQVVKYVLHGWRRSSSKHSFVFDEQYDKFSNSSLRSNNNPINAQVDGLLQGDTLKMGADPNLAKMQTLSQWNEPYLLRIAPLVEYTNGRRSSILGSTALSLNSSIKSK